MNNRLYIIVFVVCAPLTTAVHTMKKQSHIPPLAFPPRKGSHSLPTPHADLLQSSRSFPPSMQETRRGSRINTESAIPAIIPSIEDLSKIVNPRDMFIKCTNAENSPKAISKINEVWQKEKDEPVIHQFAREGLLDAIRWITLRGLSVDALNNQKETALHLVHDNITASLLLSLGADVNRTDNNGNSPLHNAIQMGYYEVAKELIKRGSNTTLKNKNGQTPFNYRMGSIESAALLFIHSKNIKNMVTQSDNNGQTPLHQLSISKITSDETKAALVHLYTLFGADPNARDKEGNLPAHITAEYITRPAAVCMRALRQEGTNFNHKNNKGMTPYTIIDKHAQSHSYVADTNDAQLIDASKLKNFIESDTIAIECILKKMPGPHEQLDEHVRNIIFTCAQKGTEKEMAYILAHVIPNPKAYKNSKKGHNVPSFFLNQDNQIPLHCVNNLGSAAALIAYGFSVNHKDDYDQTPLHTLVHSCMKPEDKLMAASFFMRVGADVLTLDAEGNTLLHTLAQHIDKAGASLLFTKFLTIIADKVPHFLTRTNELKQTTQNILIIQALKNNSASAQQALLQLRSLLNRH